MVLCWCVPLGEAGVEKFRGQSCPEPCGARLCVFLQTAMRT